MRSVLVVALICCGCSAAKVRVCFSNFSDDGRYIGCQQPNCDCLRDSVKGTCGNSPTGTTCACNPTAVAFSRQQNQTDEPPTAYEE
jgi:hypothetical protein